MSMLYDPTTDPRGFAIWAHGPQQYGPGVPYVQHLDEVVDVVREFKDELSSPALLPTMEAAGWLHDVVEDTGLDISIIHKLFGYNVSLLVGAVTNEPGANRRERHAKTYPKVRSVQGAVFLKLCDRIANVRACVRTGDTRLDMYRKEQPGFTEALYRHGEFELLWNGLTFAFIGK